MFSTATPRLDFASGSNGMTRAELILRFTLSHPNIDTVIAGTCDTKHLQENIASASAGPLPEDLYNKIKQRVM